MREFFRDMGITVLAVGGVVVVVGGWLVGFAFWPEFGLAGQVLAELVAWAVVLGIAAAAIETWADTI